MATTGELIQAARQLKENYMPKGNTNPHRTEGGRMNTEDPCQKAALELKRAKRDLLAIKAEGATDPLMCELLLAKSNLLSLAIARIEDPRCSSSERPSVAIQICE